MQRSALLAVGLVLGLVFASFVAAPPARAAPLSSLNWSSYQTIIGGSGTLSNYSATSVADSSGNIYIFYDRQVPASTLSVYVMKYKDRGPGGPVPVAGFPVQVSTVQNAWGGLTPLWNPSGAVDSSGNVYAVWGSTDHRVYVSQSTDGGLTWSVQVQANPAYENGDCLGPSIAVAPNGHVFVSWILEHPVGAYFYYNVSVAYSTDGGATFIGATNVSRGAPPYHWVGHASLAVDSHNRVHVVYSQYWVSGTAPIWVNYTHSDDGVAWSEPVSLNSAPYGGMNPRIAIDDQDTVHVAWMDQRTSGSGNNLIYYTSSSDRGQTWSVAVPISQGLVPTQGNYYVANVNVATEGTTVLVIWDGGYPTGLIDYTVSADRGATWSSEGATGTGGTWASLSVDGNGTYYAVESNMGSTPYSIGLTWWHSPPSRVQATVTAGTSSLSVSWTPAPENDTAGYRIWRSNDGSTYNLVAVVSAGATSYTDSGLGTGTYWYQVQAIDTYGYVGPASPSAIGIVGATVSQLQSAIAALQQQLANANASSAANRAALEAQIAALQSQLTTLQSAQATQTMSYVNLGFEVLVVVLLALILLMQLRRPKNPVQVLSPTPGQAVQRNPEDEL